MSPAHQPIFPPAGYSSRRAGAAPQPSVSRGTVCLGIRSQAEVVPLLERVVAAMEGAGYPERDVFGVRLALEEAVVNALKHGHKNDPGKEVAVRYHVDAQRVVAQVEDQGPGFDPEAVPDPLAPENLEKVSGRGLLLMRHYLTWLRHNRRGNAVTLCKHRSEQ